jgi:hypothetical protein|tara:strand:- start:65 stop:466 length:402 start_codon:yes stop_codon:yes gene_type:complete
MASASELRFIVDSTIGALLGNYTLPNSAQIPALWVRGTQQVPKDWTVTGTECVIDEVPELRNNPTMSRAVVLTKFWNITLTSFDEGETLEQPRLLLFRAFPDIETAVYTPQTDISFETLKITVPDYSIHSEIG